MTHNLIKDLSLGNRGWKLQCRLARIWDCINPRQHNQLISVDFLLIDEQGTSIQGTINHREGSWLKNLVKEGNIYLWTGFIVIPPKQQYRVCPNANFISVSKLTTKIEKITSDIMTTFPSNTFNFVDYKTISARQGDNTYLSDVIGELTSMGPIDEIIVNDNAVKKRNLHLKNSEGITIFTTLWNDVAYQLDDAHVKEMSEQGCVVIIIASIAVTLFSGTAALSSKSGTRVYLNLPIPETNQFQLRLKEPATVTFTPPCQSTKERMLKNRKPIAELLQLNAKDNMQKKFTCNATVTHIDDSKEWWFSACPDCKSSVKDENGTAWCQSCSKVVHETPTPWYKLKLTIADDTGTITLMAFGKHVERFVKHSAFDLANTKNANPFILPQAITKIIGTSRVFELEILGKSTSNYYTPLSFKVTGIFEEDEDSNKELLSSRLCSKISQHLPPYDKDAGSSVSNILPPSESSPIKIEDEGQTDKQEKKSCSPYKRKQPPPDTNKTE